MEPQWIPLTRAMTSCAFWPRTSERMPLRLPSQPPINYTSLMMSPSISRMMLREQVPRVLYKNAMLISSFYFINFVLSLYQI